MSTAEPSTIPRAAFIRPQPQEATEPLPEAFSPHRRGQRFVPGGMAATVQQWVLETGQAAVQSRRGQGYMRGEDYVKLEGNVRGSGPFTGRGRMQNGSLVDLLLAGCKNSSGDSQMKEIGEGKVVGIRAPVWEVEVDGKVWTVGVDWRVLSQIGSNGC